MTSEERARLRALCEEATAGPWEADEWPEWDPEEGRGAWHNCWTVRPEGEHPHGTWVADCGGWPHEEGDDRDGMEGENNARFIAASRAAVPALLDEVERLEAEVERLRGLVNHLDPEDPPVETIDERLARSPEVAPPSGRGACDPTCASLGGGVCDCTDAGAAGGR